MSIPIGLQLYSIRDDCKKDLPGTLAAVANMGYDGVEFAGYYDRPAAELRQMLDDLGLVCCGTHIKLDTMLGDALAATVEFNKALGNRFLIVPSLPEARRNSRAAWLETAGVFNQVAERLDPHGLRIGYHNHHIEFTPMDGELPWDTFFGNTAGDVVMQLDTGNCLHGGADPVQFLKRYPGRATTVHLKGYDSKAADHWSLTGEGEIDWEAVFAECEGSGGTEWYIVEQESYAHPPLVCVEKCLKNLRAMGK